jgi:hypothetical protein
MEIIFRLCSLYLCKANIVSFMILMILLEGGMSRSSLDYGEVLMCVRMYIKFHIRAWTSAGIFCSSNPRPLE